jgi:hypothetical protein
MCNAVIAFEVVIPAKAGIQSVVDGQVADSTRHIAGFPPSRE